MHDFLSNSKYFNSLWFIVSEQRRLIYVLQNDITQSGNPLTPKISLSSINKKLFIKIWRSRLKTYSGRFPTYFKKNQVAIYNSFWEKRGQTDRQTLTLDGKVDGPVTDGSNKSISFRFSIAVPLFHPPTLVILYFGTNNSKKKCPLIYGQFSP